MLEVTGQILKDVLIPQLEARKKRNEKLNRLITLDVELLDIPNRSSQEHRKIAQYARSPWAEKIVNSRVRRLSVSGIQDSTGSNDEAWKQWKQWKMIQKEKTAYREAVLYGDSYIELRKVGNKTMPFNKSPFSFVAFYGFDDFTDANTADFPLLALETNGKGVYKVWDETYITIWKKPEGYDTPIMSEKYKHGAEVVPVLRYVNDINSDGVSFGDIRPLRHIILRIQKAAYDSGLVNHNNSWNVRYATGLSSIEDVPRIDGESEDEYFRRLAKMEEGLRMELGSSDLMTSTSKDTKFGSLPATDPGSFVSTIEQNLQELAAVSDTPSDYLTGQIVAQSAEQAANSQANYLQLISEKRNIFGETHETLLRLSDDMLGKEIMSDDSSVTWAENDTGVLSAIVDALGKTKVMLGVPERELWADYPNMTPEKLERWHKAADEIAEKEARSLNALMHMGNEGNSPEVILSDALSDDQNVELEK